MPPVPPGSNAGAQYSQRLNLPAEYISSHTSPHSAENFSLDTNAQDSQQDSDFHPEMLTDKGTATG
jgi:hypothetical protein